MAGRHVHRVVNDLGSRGCFSEIRNPNYETAAFLGGEKRVRGASVVSLAGFTPYLRERFDDGADVAMAARGVYILLDAAAVSEQADTIATVKRDLRERKRGVHSVIELRNSQRPAGLFDLRA